METEYVNEVFRSESSNFYEDFAEYLMGKGRDNWGVKNCTFFNQDDKKKMWAWCLFERKA